MSIFTSTAMSKPNSSVFDLSHDIKTSFDIGELVPLTVMECLPGDKFEIDPATLLRFAPMISPVMHRVKVQTRFFFVPNRILWSEWEDFITRKEIIQAPIVQVTDLDNGSIADYMGIPPASYNPSVNPLYISALPYAAYLKIYDEYFRHQELQDEKFIPLVPGDNPDYEPIINMKPFYKGWNHDYFTSALPEPQKGPGVSVPLTMEENIPVQYEFRPGGDDQNTGGWRLAADGTPIGGSLQNVQVGNGPAPLASGTSIGGDFAAYDPQGTLNVDIQADAVDINTFRWAVRLQEWLEKMARGGSRYIEQIYAHFGQRSSDARLQRPEYIGGTFGNMAISEVLATADNVDTSTPVGNMAGHGISASGGKKFEYKCEEHGFIIGLICVAPESAYSQGVHRMWTRETALDFAWPTFAHLGEQEILNKEIYSLSSNPNGTFGYIQRYAEYKFKNSLVTGDMRNTLSFWHLGRFFQSDPVLNGQFIEQKPEDFDRIFAVQDGETDRIFCHSILNIKAVRKLPYHSIPSI